MKNGKRSRLIYGVTILVLILLIVLVNVQARQGNDKSFQTDTVTETSKRRIKEKKAAIPQVADTRSVENIAVDFMSQLFSHTKEGTEEAQSMALPELSDGIELEVKGEKNVTVSNVVVESYDIVNDSRHVLVSFTQINNKKETSREVFIVIIETENGFKVSDFATEVYNEEPH